MQDIAIVLQFFAIHADRPMVPDKIMTGFILNAA